MIFWSAPTDQGPIAAPGQYQVRLTANGVTETRPLTVSKDPRLNVTDADLAEQFRLAMEVRDKTSEANEIVIRIREIKKNIADRVKKDPSLDAAGERLSTKLSAVEEDIYQVRNRSNQDPLNFPIKLNNQIAALQRVIETGDAKPTDQSYVVFKELSQKLAEIKKRYEEILKTDTAGFSK
jgi:phage shock protein A